jgi:hypothetical protein
MPKMPPMPPIPPMPKPPVFRGPPPAFWPPAGVPNANGGNGKNCKCAYTVQKYLRKNRKALLKKWQKQIQAWMQQAKAARKKAGKAAGNQD